MKALVLAAGRGRNLKPFTTSRSTHMVMIAGKYLLENTVNLLAAAGITEINIVVGHKAEKIVDHFQRGKDFHVNIQYIYQDAPGEIGDAILLARERILPDQYFLLVYGDILTPTNIFSKTIQGFNLFRSPIASICLTPSTKPYGNIFMNDEMKITRIIEKPEENNLGNYVLSGVFVLPTTFFTLLEETQRNMEGALSLMVGRHELYASIWEEDWIDIGYPWDILSANHMAMSTWEESSISRFARLNGDVKIEGPVRIERDVIIESGTSIRGPCYIGPGCFVGNNVLIREYTTIGPNSVIGFGVELKNCVMFGNNKVGRLSFIGDSVVGENVYIGSGTMTINGNLDGSPVQTVLEGISHETNLLKVGSFIGDNAKIGASNTLAAGTVIEYEGVIPHNHSWPLRG
ncbi:MAG: NTP transferase domain-containing protein [Candidatus Tectomicrobia bacterium]|nr:NTP transferase domain-containing protein [Candidatus Tectomicrobia bacterium]